MFLVEKNFDVVLDAPIKGWSVQIHTYGGVVLVVEDVVVEVVVEVVVDVVVELVVVIISVSMPVIDACLR